MKTTRYFDEQVLRKRPYLSWDMCLKVLQSPMKTNAYVFLRGYRHHQRRNPNFARGYVGRRRNRPQRLLRPRLQGAGQVKLHYYPETDSLYIELMSKPGVETREIVTGLVADFDAEGAVVGFNIDGASHKLDLATLETVALPLTAMKVA